MWGRKGWLDGKWRPRACLVGAFSVGVYGAEGGRQVELCVTVAEAEAVAASALSSVSVSVQGSGMAASAAPPGSGAPGSLLPSRAANARPEPPPPPPRPPLLAQRCACLLCSRRPRGSAAAACRLQPALAGPMPSAGRAAQRQPASALHAASTLQATQPAIRTRTAPAYRNRGRASWLASRRAFPVSRFPRAVPPPPVWAQALFFRDFSNMPARERMHAWDAKFSLLKSLPHVSGARRGFQQSPTPGPGPGAWGRRMRSLALAAIPPRMGGPPPPPRSPRPPAPPPTPQPPRATQSPPLAAPPCPLHTALTPAPAHRPGAHHAACGLPHARGAREHRRSDGGQPGAVRGGGGRRRRRAQQRGAAAGRGGHARVMVTLPCCQLAGDLAAQRPSLFALSCSST